MTYAQTDVSFVFCERIVQCRDFFRDMFAFGGKGGDLFTIIRGFFHDDGGIDKDEESDRDEQGDRGDFGFHDFIVSFRVKEVFPRSSTVRRNTSESLTP